MLKAEIIKKYKSLRQFCLKLDIPYSTLSTALDRGIDGMAYGTVLKMCEDLMLSPIDFSPLAEHSSNKNAVMYRQQFQRYIAPLNKKGISRLMGFVDDLLLIPQYTEKEREDT